MTARHVGAGLLILSLAGAALAAGPAAGNARDALRQQMAALAGVKDLHAKFVSEKVLAMLDQPLVTEGEVWIAQPARVRFSTLTPYRSELILDHHQVLAKSQHEQDWTVTQQSSRPGLTAVMNQLGSWALGNFKDILDMYKVEAGSGPVPPRPGAAHAQAPKLDVFELVPENKDLAKSVKAIALGIDPKTHELGYFELLTTQGDKTRYWFYDVVINTRFNEKVFAPADKP